MIKVTTQWISRAVQGSMVGGSLSIDSVSTDTRTINQGSLFIALRGESFDGHQFIEQAIEKGAKAVMVDHPLSINVPQIVVDNTTLALGALGAAIKRQLQLKTVAITGSMGKTTVKEMVAAILSRLGNVLATQGNFNNEIGVPLTLLRLDIQHDFAVIEQGANHKGEIAYTTGLSRPDVCLINNIAPAHIEGFGSLEGVAEAKGEIYQHSSRDCIAIVNGDSDYSERWLTLLAKRKVLVYSCHKNHNIDIWSENIRLDETGCATFDLCRQNIKQDEVQLSKNQLSKSQLIESIPVQLTVPGMHNVKNALAAACIGASLGASFTDIALGLEQMQPVKGRVNIIKINEQLTLIDDSYNANVESVKAGIDLLTESETYNIMVFGDMAEMGVNAEQYHKEVGEYADHKGVDYVFSLGVLSQYAGERFAELSVEQATGLSSKQATGLSSKQATGLSSKQATGLSVEKSQHFETCSSLMPHLYHLIDSIEQRITMLIKGSRSAKTELVVKALENHYNVEKHDIEHYRTKEAS